MSRLIDPRLLQTAPAARRLLLGYGLFQCIGVLATIAQAMLLARVIVGVVQARPAHQLISDLVLLACVGTARAILAAAQEWLAARSSLRVRAQLRTAVLRSLRQLGPAWAQRQAGGDLVTAAGPGLENLDGYLARALPAVVSVAIVPVAVLGWIGWTDWRSGLILLLVLPLVPLFMALVGVSTGRRMRHQYELLARMSGHFLDLVSGLATLRVYGRAEHQIVTVRAATESYRRHTMATLRTAFLSSLALDLVATLSIALVAVDVGLRLDHNSMSFTTALVVLLLAPELFAPLRAMGAQHHANEEGQVVAAAALTIVDQAVEADGARRSPATLGAAAAVTAARRADGVVALEDVTVTHHGRADSALTGLSLRLVPGEVVVLRGRSGAGKSTVLSCLLGFVTPATGRVTVAADAVALQSIDAAGWRATTAWLPQRPRPTQDSVGAEVALGDPGASAEQIAQAIATCHALHPATDLGEDGGHISAGQRRRVALARVLLRARRVIAQGDVPLVLLDEPSEDLDAVTELVVVSVIAELAGRATVLIATHSDRVAAAADRVIELADGRLVSDRHQVPERHSVAAQVPLAATTVPIEQAAPTQRRPWRDRESAVRSVLPARRTARLLTYAGLLSGAAGLAGLALTACSLWLICRASLHPNVQALAIAVVGVRTFALGRALLRYVERLVTHDGAMRLLSDVRARVFAALARIVPSGVDVRRGDLLRRFVTDVDGVQDALVRAVVPSAGAFLTAVGAVGLASVIVPMSGAVLAGGLFVGLVVAPLTARAIAGQARHAGHLSAARDAAAIGLIEGLAELTAYGADGAAADRVAALDARAADEARLPTAGASVGVGLSAAAAAVCLPLVLATAASAVVGGSVSGVDAAVLVACVLAGFEALAGIPAAAAAWSRFRAGFDRVAELLSSPVPVGEPDAPVAIGSDSLVRAGLVFDAACVAPAAGAPFAVVDESFAVRPGQRIAVVGPSGCGKSTLLTAAVRLLPVGRGTIDLIGTASSDSCDSRIPLRDIASAAVAPLVAGSLQGDHVFDATLRDNLRVVRPDATDADLDQVASRTGLASFLDALPQRWSTPAGPDGAGLSGGQRQRLLLARALLAAPSVLVLDEPTAHLDAEVEREVLADLLCATSDQTVLMSTHRALPAGAFTTIVRMSDANIATSVVNGTKVLSQQAVGPGTRSDDRASMGSGARA